jgi:hypothetical protein
MIYPVTHCGENGANLPDTRILSKALIAVLGPRA